MDNLTFSFMEKTKNIPMPSWTMQLLYRFKSLLLFILILLSQIYTSGVFIEQFILFCLVSLLCLVLLSTPAKPLLQNWHQIYFLLLFYSLLPFYTPGVIYILSALLLILTMQFLFVKPNGYFINPVVLILCFLMALFPLNFMTPSIQPFFFLPKDSFFILDSFNTQFFPLKALINGVIGFFPYFPAAFLGIFILFIYLFPATPKFIYQGFFSYILGTVIFSLFLSLMIYGTSLAEYFQFLSGIFSKAGIVFVGLFLVPETLGNPLNNRYPLFFSLLSALLSVIIYALLPSLLMSAVTAYLFTFICCSLFPVYKVKNKQRE